jgi:hypothetical protein
MSSTLTLPWLRLGGRVSRIVDVTTPRRGWLQRTTNCSARSVARLRLPFLCLSFGLGFTASLCTARAHTTRDEPDGGGGPEPEFTGGPGTGVTSTALLTATAAPAAFVAVTAHVSQWATSPLTIVYLLLVACAIGAPSLRHW